jgi:hypothetical protein
LKRTKDLVIFFRTQIATENQIADSLNLSLGKIGNPTIKGVLKGIYLESAKHAEMYSLTIDLLTSVSKSRGQAKMDTHKDFMEKHIEMESDMIEKITKVLLSVENEKVKVLLNSILMDKKRHLELLRQILEITAIEETITEENWEDIWWDMIWKDARGST